MIRHIHHKSMIGGINNIQVLLAQYEDPKVPIGVDVVFICDVLHHVKNRPQWLSKLYNEMNRGSRLVLIEFKEGKLPAGPPEKVKISSREMMATVVAAGFKLSKKDTGLLPYQYYYEFIK
jgi:hypothetical protein